MVEVDHHSVGSRTEASVPCAPVLDPLDHLLVLSAQGDQRAFRRLYDASSSKLLTVALSMLRRRDAAEDALQDAYVRIWSRASDYQPSKGHALAWMIRVLRNIVLDRMRRERLVARYHVCEDEVAESAGPAVLIDERIDLVRGLEGLSVEQRSAIVSVLLTGWTHEETGQRSGIPTPTSKARTLRGLKRLKSLYEGEAVSGLGGSRAAAR